MPLRSIATFLVKPGEADRFERAYRAGGFLERAVTNPGFIRGELLRPGDEPDRFIAIAEWESEADYAAWQAAYDQLPAEHVAEMFDALAGPPTSMLGPIILTADRSTVPPGA